MSDVIRHSLTQRVEPFVIVSIWLGEKIRFVQPLHFTNELPIKILLSYCVTLLKTHDLTCMNDNWELLCQSINNPKKIFTISGVNGSKKRRYLQMNFILLCKFLSKQNHVWQISRTLYSSVLNIWCATGLTILFNFFVVDFRNLCDFLKKIRRQWAQQRDIDTLKGKANQFDLW